MGKTGDFSKKQLHRLEAILLGILAVGYLTLF